MSPQLPNLKSLVASTMTSIRRDAFFAIGGAVAVLAGLTLLIAWLVSSFERWPAPSPWPLLLDLLALALTGIPVSAALRHLFRLLGQFGLPTVYGFLHFPHTCGEGSWA